MPIDPISSSSSSLPPILQNLNLSTVQQTALGNDLSQLESGAISGSQFQSDIQSTLTQSQQSQLQTELQAHKGHHHHHDDQSNASTASTATSSTQAANPLGLTTIQQQQIESLVNTAVANGTSASDLQSQIDAILTGTQKEQVQNGTPLFSTSA